MTLPDPADRPTLTSAEVAELFRVPVAHVWRLAREGRAPVRPIRLGRRIRWPTAAVVALLAGAERDGSEAS